MNIHSCEATCKLVMLLLLVQTLVYHMCLLGISSKSLCSCVCASHIMDAYTGNLTVYIGISPVCVTASTENSGIKENVIHRSTLYAIVCDGNLPSHGQLTGCHYLRRLLRNE